MSDTSKILHPNELPAWMRPRRRIFDWGLLIIVVFCVLVIWPFIVRNGLPRNTDAELFEFRSLEIARLAKNGVLFSRWAPDLNYGFGSPLFNYLAPLPHYLPGYHQALTESSPVDSVKLFLELSIGAAGIGMYFFARQRWGAPAGILGALIYLFSPPIALALPHFSGDLALLMALGLLPWALWALDGLWLSADWRIFWLAVILLTAFILCDARITGIASVVVAATALTGARMEGAQRYLWRYVLAAVLCSIALTAFFWLPAILERDAIHWIPADTDPRAGPVPLSESLAIIPRFDLQQLNVPVFRGIGIGTWLLALLGLAAYLRARLRPRGSQHVAPSNGTPLYLIIGLTLFALSTPVFYSLWPSPDSFQPLLPYHALLVATFCFAVVGAQSVRWLAAIRMRWRLTALVILCLVAPLTALPALYPPEWGPEQGLTTLNTGLENELRGQYLATFRTGMLLPSTAPGLPSPLPTMIEGLNTDDVDRVNRQGLSTADKINLLGSGLLSNSYQVQTAHPIQVEFLILDYPGWSVSLNGQRRSVEPSAQGLIDVDIPLVSNADTTMVVWLDGTPPRYLSWLITIMAGVICVLLGRRFRARQRSAEYRSAPLSPVPLYLSRRQAVGLMLMLAIYGGSTVWVRGNPDLILPRSPPGEIYGLMTPLPRFLQGGIDLLGYHLSELVLQPGQTLDVSVYWEAARPIAKNNQSELLLVDPDSGQVVAGVAHRHPGRIPTTNWLLNSYVRDDFSLTIPPNLAGVLTATNTTVKNYSLRLVIGPCDSQQLPICDNLKGMDAFDPFGHSETGGVTIPRPIGVILQE